MNGWQIAFAACLIGSLAACGGRAEDSPAQGRNEGGSGAVPFGGSTASGGTRGMGGTRSSGGSPSLQGGRPAVGGSGYVDPGCPNTEPPQPLMECDPLAPDSDCPTGTACYPYVEHPFGDGCGTSVFGASCFLAGTGEQGAVCGDGSSSCAHGYICVVGAHAGRRCAKLCTFQPGECDSGLICNEVDIQGYGVCS